MTMIILSIVMAEIVMLWYITATTRETDRYIAELQKINHDRISSLSRRVAELEAKVEPEAMAETVLNVPLAKLPSWWPDY